MKTTNQRHEDAVEAIAKRLLRVSSVSLAPIPTYPDSIVYRVASDAGALVFKGHDPSGSDDDRIAEEATALSRAGRAGVPVPEVVELDTSGAVFPSAYLVMTSADGVPLDTLDQAEVVKAGPAVGEVLRRLHGIQGELPGWRDFVSSPIPAALDYLAGLPAGTFDVSRLRRGVDRALKQVEEPAHSVLLHGDLGENHVFVDQATGRVTSLIDFGEVGSGLWLWDLLEFDRRFVTGLLDGYGIAAEERDEVNRLVVVYALLKAVPWAAKWHARGEPQVLAWLRRTLEMFEDNG